MAITVSQPPAGQCVKVKTNATSATVVVNLIPCKEGVICATGTAVSNEENADEVKGRVYRTTDTIPSSPPADAHTKTANLNGSYWEFSHTFGNELPNALCLDLQCCNNDVLAIWARYPPSATNWERVTVDFEGKCDTITECQTTTS